MNEKKHNDNHILTILKMKRELILEDLAKIDKAIDALLGEDSAIQWTSKSLRCIQNNGHVMKAVEILDCLFYNYKDRLQDAGRRRNYMTALSVALNKLVSQGKLKKIVQPGTKGHYYGLSEWYNETGIIKAYDKRNKQQVA